MPSTISKPLYVEMLDQTGHITQRQIIELNSGEGHGQIILNESTMSGYYEIRHHPLDARIQRTFLLLRAFRSGLRQSSGERPERRISTYNPESFHETATEKCDR